MTMCMFKIIAVSNWELYQESHGTNRFVDYAEHLAHLAELPGYGDGSSQAEELPRPDFLILREKSLQKEKYLKLAKSVAKASKKTGLIWVAHTWQEAIGISERTWIHLPLPLLKKAREEGGVNIGTSVHSAEEAVQAQKLGASYVTAGHVFATQCKSGLPPRGLEFLEEVCRAVSIEVYAIGGIHPNQIESVRNTGVSGVCMMSEYMKK